MEQDLPCLLWSLGMGGCWMPLGKILETFLGTHSKKFMKEDKQGKGRMQWTNGRAKEKHKRACEKMLKMVIKVGSVSLNYVTELPLLEPWTFLNNDKGHICEKHMDKLLKVVINWTDACYISKNENCFVSWKILKNAYSNFDDQYLNSSSSEQILQPVFEFFHVWEVSSF